MLETRRCVGGLAAGLLVVLAVTACAQLEFLDQVGDSGTNDTGGEDIAEDAALDTSEPGPCDGLDPVCVPGGLACSPDGSAVVRCDETCPVATDVEVFTCGEQEICDRLGLSVTCRPCIPGECGPIYDICDPEDLAPVCVSWSSRAQCTDLGDFGPSQVCPSGQRCIGGTCNTGAQTGATCQNDGQCESRACVCGTVGYTAFPGAVDCPVPLNLGYCTTNNCVQDGCRPGERCVDFAGTVFYRARSLCLPVADCEEAGSPCVGESRFYTCNELPTRTSASQAFRSWDLVCFPRQGSHIGESCTSDQLCIGGRCQRRTYPSGAESYCTATCATDVDCPSFAVCATPPGGAAPLCLVRADACEERLDASERIVQAVVTTEDGAEVEVCWLQPQ